MSNEIQPPIPTWARDFHGETEVITIYDALEYGRQCAEAARKEEREAFAVEVTRAIVNVLCGGVDDEDRAYDSGLLHASASLAAVLRNRNARDKTQLNGAAVFPRNDSHKKELDNDE